MKHALNAIAINRAKRPTKLIDGSGLFYQRNRDGSLTPWQRLRQPGGKSRDVKVAAPVLGEITTDWLLNIRHRAFALKTAGHTSVANGTVLFAELWSRYCHAVSKWSPSTRANYKIRMERYIGPTRLWSTPAGSITVLDVEDAVSEARQARPLLAPRLLLDIRAALRWGMSRGEVSDNPAAKFIDALRHAEHKPKGKKYPALTDITKLRAVLATIETSNLFSSLRHAMVLQAFTVQRTGNVVATRWTDLDLPRGRWTIARAALKVKDDEERGDLVLTLHPIVVAMLKKLPRPSPWVFPSPSDPKKHVDAPQIAHAMARLGYGGVHTPHGWRSALKTLADAEIGSDDRPLFAARWTEDVLDHAVAGVQAHYSRARAEQGMKRVLLWWGDLIAGGSETTAKSSASQ